MSAKNERGGDVKMGRLGISAKLLKAGVGGAVLGVAALAGPASGDGGANWRSEANWANRGESVGGSAALEEAFFETLGRCESPLLLERDEAEDALFKRFAEFEPVWQDKRFLTNGEISPEARIRFELAEARYRAQAFEECVGAFKSTFETVASEPENRKGRMDGEEKRGEREENALNGEENSENKKEGKDADVGEIRRGAQNEKEEGNDGDLRGRVSLRWNKPLRVVYLAPDWSVFERRDGEGKRWRPSGRFSTPELTPEFDATELNVETRWERVDELKAALSGDGEGGEGNGRDGGNEWDGEDEGGARNESGTAIGGNEWNGEGRTTVVGAFEGLVGGDFRVWSLPLGPIAIKNAEDGGNAGNIGDDEDKGKGKEGEDGGDRGDRKGKEEEGKSNARRNGGEETGGDAATRGAVEFSTVFQSGDASATVGETTINEKGETTARVRLDFAEAFDAFDSHRFWLDQNDFCLISDDAADWCCENLGGDGDISVSGVKNASGEKGKEGERREEEKRVETQAEGRRWTATRLRARERSERGVLLELDFPNDAALREAVAEGRARLACRVPRFLFWTRFEVAGIEIRSDDAEFNGRDDKTADATAKIEKKLEREY